jgi:hypothetical protein
MLSGMKNGRANTATRRQFSASAKGAGMSRQNSAGAKDEVKRPVSAMFQMLAGTKSMPQLSA